MEAALQMQQSIRAGLRPELDGTKELTAELSNWYMHLIGMLQWMVGIGQVDMSQQH